MPFVRVLRCGDPRVGPRQDATFLWIVMMVLSRAEPRAIGGTFPALADEAVCLRRRSGAPAKRGCVRAAVTPHLAVFSFVRVRFTKQAHAMVEMLLCFLLQD